MLKKIVKRILPEFILEFLRIYLRRGVFKSSSQEGEDMLLRRIFEQTKKGFYVDVGAHHPIRASNTRYFYDKGWRGINIDAMPGCMKAFDKLRSRDINIEVPISNEKKKLTYYNFKNPNSLLNTFDQTLGEKRCLFTGIELISKNEIQTFTLEEVLDKYLPSGQSIDFLSVDVEGLDLQVLKSNNFKKYQPKVILVELLDPCSWDELSNDPVAQYLEQFEYRIFAKLYYTVVFVHKEFVFL